MTLQLCNSAFANHENDIIKIPSIWPSKHEKLSVSFNRIMRNQATTESERVSDFESLQVDLNYWVIRGVWEATPSNNCKKTPIFAIEEAYCWKIGAMLPDITLMLRAGNRMFFPLILFYSLCKRKSIKIGWMISILIGATISNQLTFGFIKEKRRRMNFYLIFQRD